MRSLVENPLLLKKGKASRKDIGGDTFLRLQKISVRFLSPKHNIANDQQRPRISESLKCIIDRAVRPSPRFLHTHSIPHITCMMQVIRGILVQWTYKNVYYRFCLGRCSST